MRRLGQDLTPEQIEAYDQKIQRNIEERAHDPQTFACPLCEDKLVQIHDQPDRNFPGAHKPVARASWCSCRPAWIEQQKAELAKRIAEHEDSSELGFMQATIVRYLENARQTCQDTSDPARTVKGTWKALQQVGVTVSQRTIRKHFKALVGGGYICPEGQSAGSGFSSEVWASTGKYVEVK